MKSTGLAVGDTEILLLCAVMVWTYPNQHKSVKLILYAN